MSEIRVRRKCHCSSTQQKKHIRTTYLDGMLNCGWELTQRSCSRSAASSVPILSSLLLVSVLISGSLRRPSIHIAVRHGRIGLVRIRHLRSRRALLHGHRGSTSRILMLWGSRVILVRARQSWTTTTCQLLHSRRGLVCETKNI